MKRLAVIPSDPIEEYLKKGYSAKWLKDYYNPGHFFDEVYLLSNLEKDQLELLGMRVIHTEPKDFPKRLKELKIDIVRAYGGNWACELACGHKISGVPVVVSVHDSSANKLKNAIEQADVVLCVSEAVRSLVAGKLKNKNRLWMLPNRVDFDVMRPYAEDQTSDLNARFPFRYKILHVGRLSREKNLDTLIKALSILEKDYCVIAVGQGDLDLYQKLALEYHVRDRVFFIDAVPHEELGRYYSMCSCMCTPSRWEGFGMVFIEALACNGVVVTSDIAPLNEYIVHEGNGLLVKEFEDPQSIAHMIRRACMDVALRDKIQKNARESVRIFEKDRIDRQEIGLYKKIFDLCSQGEFGIPVHNKADIIRNIKVGKSYKNALEWVGRHTIPEQGIIVHTDKLVPYLEVTGYLIPTLIEANDWGRARSYAQYLAYMQRANGAYCGPDGREYVFDTGQALRGLVAASLHWPEFRAIALKTADFIISQIDPQGRIYCVYEGDIPEYVQVFVLPALLEAGHSLERPEYIEAARRSIHYYKQQADVLSHQYLMHFLAYILDGFIDMGEADFVRPFVKEVFSHQKKDGSIRAYEGVHWTCSVGLAQMAVVGYKLGMLECADKILDYLCSIQNKSGGFYGSYGVRAKYFPKEEISWANKFFLDAIQLKLSVKNNHHILQGSQVQWDLLDNQEWHKAITAGHSVDELVMKIKGNDFPVWCKPLLTHTRPGDVLLELGSGTGELAAICALYGRSMHLLDYSTESNLFAGQLFKELGLSGEFYWQDILKGISLNSASVDWVYSSGVLEHFSDGQIIGILKESRRLARQGVMSLVPNANALFYRIGKYKMEQEGTWGYGHEDPKWTMRPLFEAAGLNHIQEYSIGTFHGLKFWGEGHEDIKQFLDQCSPEQLQLLNQGYLLFTIGWI